MANRKWVVGACVVFTGYLCFPACGPTMPGPTGGAGGVAGTAGGAGIGGASDAGSDADASPVACGCDDIRSSIVYPFPTPVPHPYQRLACYCDRAGAQCGSSMRAYAEQLCQNQPVLRRQGCGRAVLWGVFSEWDRCQRSTCRAGR